MAPCGSLGRVWRLRRFSANTAARVLTRQQLRLNMTTHLVLPDVSLFLQPLTTCPRCAFVDSFLMLLTRARHERERLPHLICHSDNRSFQKHAKPWGTLRLCCSNIDTNESF